MGFYSGRSEKDTGSYDLFMSFCFHISVDSSSFEGKKDLENTADSHFTEYF